MHILRKVLTVEIYCQYARKISICLNRGLEELVGNDDISIVCAWAWLISLTRCDLDRITIEMRHINSFTHEPLWVVTHTAWPDAKEYPRMSQNLPKRSLRDFLSLRHPNHFVLAGANNRNVIITYRFLAAPVQANQDFSGILTVYFNCKYFPQYTRNRPKLRILIQWKWPRCSLCIGQ